jgi:pteridine reductase
MSKSKERSLEGKCALITGAGRRIGAAITQRLHLAGANVAIHYRGSADEARTLADALNDQRAGSATVIQADLTEAGAANRVVRNVIEWHGAVDILVNNASTFYATPLGTITEAHWEELIGSNLKAPLFLSQAAQQTLQDRKGCIVNIVDIHSQRPLRHHTVYGSAKAGLAMLTRSLAKDLAPHVRVNGISPGAIMWPENGMTESAQQEIVAQIPLGRPGIPQDIADGVLFLVRDANYITGQILAIDGGRSLGW